MKSSRSTECCRKYCVFSVTPVFTTPLTIITKTCEAHIIFRQEWQEGYSKVAWLQVLFRWTTFLVYSGTVSLHSSSSGSKFVLVVWASCIYEARCSRSSSVLCKFLPSLHRKTVWTPPVRTWVIPVPEVQLQNQLCSLWSPLIKFFSFELTNIHGTIKISCIMKNNVKTFQKNVIYANNASRLVFKAK